MSTYSLCNEAINWATFLCLTLYFFFTAFSQPSRLFPPRPRFLSASSSLGTSTFHAFCLTSTISFFLYTLAEMKHLNRFSTPTNKILYMVPKTGQHQHIYFDAQKSVEFVREIHKGLHGVWEKLLDIWRKHYDTFFYTHIYFSFTVLLVLLFFVWFRES